MPYVPPQHAQVRFDRPSPEALAAIQAETTPGPPPAEEPTARPSRPTLVPRLSIRKHTCDPFTIAQLLHGHVR